MGNCISKISKDRLFALEEFMKNKTSFEKGRARPSLDRLTRGKYTRIHSVKGFSKKKKRLPRYKLACGGENFFKWVTEATSKDILCYPKRVAHCVPLLG